jgi:3-oxoadipate enol-lactonase
MAEGRDEMPFTDAPGFRMSYEVHGSGFPLLLINGLGSDREEWLHQLPVFAPHFRVVTFDNRGSGDSATPPGLYSTALMANDAAALLAFLGIERAHVLGVSLGGMIAQEIALRHPERVARLVLACTSPGGEASERPSREVLAAFARTPGADPGEELSRTIPYLYTERYRREHPGEIAAFVQRRLRRPAPAEAHAFQLAAAVGHAAADRLSVIGAPTLVITGTGDRVVPPVNSRRIAARIPGARLVLLPGAPHRLFAENAEAFNREVLSFLLEGGTGGKESPGP